MTTVTLSPRVRVAVPRDVRDAMRLKPGQKFQMLDEEGLILFVPVVPM